MMNMVNSWSLIVQKKQHGLMTYQGMSNIGNNQRKKLKKLFQLMKWMIYRNSVVGERAVKRYNCMTKEEAVTDVQNRSRLLFIYIAFICFKISSTNLAFKLTYPSSFQIAEMELVILRLLISIDVTWLFGTRSSMFSGIKATAIFCEIKLEIVNNSEPLQITFGLNPAAIQAASI